MPGAGASGWTVFEDFARLLCGFWPVHRPGGVLEGARKGVLPVDESSRKFTLSDLAARVKDRASASPETSYTRKLLDQGVGHCAKKFGEEAVETVLAAVSEDRDRLVSETADLLYHLLVVLEARGVALADVEAALAARLGQSGLEEKASRARK